MSRDKITTVSVETRKKNQLFPKYCFNPGCYIAHVNGKLSKHFNWQMANKLSCYHLLISIFNSKKLTHALTVHIPQYF